MKKLIIAIFLLLAALLIISSCKDKLEDCTQEDYDNCNTQKPQFGKVTVRLTINTENPDVILKIYQGNFEDANIVLEQSTSSRYITEFLKVDTYYSFAVKYKRGRENITAVDGGKIKLKSYKMCEYRCYEAVTLDIDLTVD
jgi:hypothetical protein